jgi:mannose-6-phosphate isomerase-like protein (cupin superfamily)
MSQISASDHAAVLVRSADAERIGFPPQTVRLLADGSSTGGKLSAQRVTLQGGAGGANPHHHVSSAELFYVVSGSAQLLAGDRVLRSCRRGSPSRRPDCRTHLRLRRHPTPIC